MPTVTTTRILHLPAKTSRFEPHSSWIWPLPKIDGVTPSIVGSVDESDEVVDIGYPDWCSTSCCLPVFAAQEGVISYAGTAEGSLMVCVDHAGGWSTQYADFEHLLVTPTDRFRRRRKTRIRSGDVLGHVRQPSQRVRFGLTRLDESNWRTINPTELMRSWVVVPWSTPPATIRRAEHLR